MSKITANALILVAAFVAVASVALAAGQKVKEGDEVPKMEDLAIELGERPGALADLGEALGRAGISIEGEPFGVEKRISCSKTGQRREGPPKEPDSKY